MYLRNLKAECPVYMDGAERRTLGGVIHNTSGVLVRHRFEPMHAFGSVDVIELEVFDMPDILVVGLVHDERQLIVSAGNRNDERRFVDVFASYSGPYPRAAARHWARYITLIFTVPLLLPVHQKSCTIQPLYGILK